MITTAIGQIEDPKDRLVAFVLERQSFEGLKQRDDYVFTPFGVRHDNPLAAVGSVAGSLTIKARDLKPLPVIHVAGENDPLVKFTWQEATFVAVRRFNGCTDEGKPYAKEGVLEATLFPSTKGAPLVTAIHHGGHEYAKGSSELIARFFKENPRK